MTMDADIAAYLRARPDAAPTPLAELRRETDRELTAIQGAPEPVARVENTHPAGGVRMWVYRPAGQRPGERPPVLPFAHAGGWCLVSLEAGDTPCRARTNATGCVVISVDYRLAPEHPYPTPLEDYYRALVWVAEQAERLGVDAARLIVGGDSAGANLAAGAALLARDRHGPAIAHQLRLYPPLDVDFDTPSYRAHAEGCYLTRAAMRWCRQTYLGAAWPCPRPMPHRCGRTRPGCRPPRWWSTNTTPCAARARPIRTGWRRRGWRWTSSASTAWSMPACTWRASPRPPGRSSPASPPRYRPSAARTPDGGKAPIRTGIAPRDAPASRRGKAPPAFAAAAPAPQPHAARDAPQCDDALTKGRFRAPRSPGPKSG